MACISSISSISIRINRLVVAVAAAVAAAVIAAEVTVVEVVLGEAMVVATMAKIVVGGSK